MSACNATYNACYNQCKSDFPFLSFKFGKRNECFADCDSAYAGCLQTEEVDSSGEQQQQAKALKPVFYIMGALVLLVIIGKWRKWF